MINVKSGTRTWANNANAPEMRAAPKSHDISAADQKKYFSDQESLGDTLNRIADANWVDPSKKMRTVGSDKLGKDAFMKMLLTQMKNQDPTNPMKSHDMAAQLAQFTSLEKLTNIDSGINALRKQGNPKQNFEALSLIGKSITTDSSELDHSQMNQAHDLRFRLAADAAKATVQIKDQKGDVVRTLTFNNLKAGKTDLAWNGLMKDGTPAPIGEYTMAVDARSSNGSKVYAETKIEGVITGVNFTPKGPQVMIGKRMIDMADIKSIHDPKLDPSSAPTNLKVANPPKKGQSGQAPHYMAVKPETKKDEDPMKQVRLSQGSIGDVAMAQGMINNLNKNGVKAGM